MATNDVISELRSWLKDNWDPDLTLGEWWERLGLAGWSAPSLPKNAYGRELSRSDSVAVGREIVQFGALGAPGGLGLLLAAPTIAMFGTQEQIDLYVRDIVTGKKAWCQLFSEPGAGSDLAGLNAKALRDGDEWIVNGQKVWTSGGQWADLGMLIARTDPEVPKHQGISYFAFDMHQPGVEIRPLREMTGHAMFNEVFMTDARVPHANMISGLNNGWAVANATLMFERAGLGSGGGGGGSFGAIPGSVAGHLTRRVGDFIENRKPGRATQAGGSGAGYPILLKVARANGKVADPSVRQDLVKLYTLGEIGRFNNERVKAARAAGKDIAGMPNIGKLSMSDMVRLQRDLGLRIVGPAGMVHGYTDEQTDHVESEVGVQYLPAITFSALYAQAPPIYGGSDQVQRNIIGERVLGLPKEPSNEKTTPFSQLPKNG